jgi:23S rRNA (adenine2030-N6)-methyltransferase
VIVDPPYEQPNEFTRLFEGLQAAHRKWPSGIYLLWYPIKDRHEPDALARQLARSGMEKIARIELGPARPKEHSGLRGSGLILVNPPWTLEGELAVLLPVLASVLGCDKSKWCFEWLAREIMPQ